MKLRVLLALGAFLGFLLIVAPAQKRPEALFGGHVPQAGVSGAAIPAGVTLYALDNDNTIWRKGPNQADFRSLVRVSRLFTQEEQLIGIDVRPADGLLYAISDAGTIYTIDVTGEGKGNVVRISQTAPRFAGGVQSLMDFNPVLNALRLIGSNDQNLAVVNGNGNLQTTAPQTRITYDPADANAGADPNLTGGSYTNNLNGATVTIFYGLDYSTGSLVTIDPATPGGSSATGGGKLHTIGRLQTFDGNPLNVTPTADLDIFTDANGVNTLIGITGRTLFTIPVAQIPQPQLGTTVPVVVRTSKISNGGLIDVAAAVVAKGKGDE